MENLMSVMEEKAREQKRARTVRTEYNRGKDVLQSWLQQAELKVQDKTSQPQVIKETLQHIHAELPAMQDKLDQVTQSAKVICENSNDPEEVSLITENVNTLTEQLTMIRAWIDEKKQQVGDSLDSWERFMTLYNTVLNWVHEKKEFLKLPLYLANLEQAKAKLHDYNGAAKSCKNMGKTLSEMSKELNHISENGSIGDLSEKMEEAETAKAEVESQLLERNALLHEATEEWEQCEKKLREVRAWINKTKSGLEQGAGKKKPLRDQLATKEKVMADITIQKTKISVSIEKLQVHFKNSLSGGEGVTETGETMKKELDGLLGVVRQQSIELEEAINQVEQYQQEVLQLKQEVLESEQKLRTISSPTYLPNERDTVVKEQIDLRNNIQRKRDKISDLVKMVRIHNPVWPYLVEMTLFCETETPTPHDLCDKLSYADVTAGRISPCPQGGSRTASPVHIDRSHIYSIERNIFEQNKLKDPNEFIKREQIFITSSAVPKRIDVFDNSSQDEGVASDESDKSPIECNKFEQQIDDIFKTPEIQINVVEEPPPTRRLSRFDHYSRSCDSNPSQIQIDTSRDRSKSREIPSAGIFPLMQPLRSRSRSKSPLWIPGESASYSDVVKGMSRNNSRAPSIEDLSSLQNEPDNHNILQTSYTAKVTNDATVTETFRLNEKHKELSENKELIPNQVLTQKPVGVDVSVSRKNKKQMNKQCESTSSSNETLIPQTENVLARSTNDMKPLEQIDLTISGSHCMIKSSEQISPENIQSQILEETSFKSKKKAKGSKQPIEEAVSNKQTNKIKSFDPSNKDATGGKANPVKISSKENAPSAPKVEEEKSETDHEIKKKKNRKRRGKTKDIPQEIMEGNIIEPSKETSIQQNIRTMVEHNVGGVSKTITKITTQKTMKSDNVASGVQTERIEIPLDGKTKFEQSAQTIHTFKTLNDAGLSHFTTKVIQKDEKDFISLEENNDEMSLNSLANSDQVVVVAKDKKKRKKKNTKGGIKKENEDEPKHDVQVKIEKTITNKLDNLSENNAYQLSAATPMVKIDAVNKDPKKGKTKSRIKEETEKSHRFSDEDKVGRDIKQSEKEIKAKDESAENLSSGKVITVEKKEKVPPSKKGPKKKTKNLNEDKKINDSSDVLPEKQITEETLVSIAVDKSRGKPKQTAENIAEKTLQEVTELIEKTEISLGRIKENIPDQSELLVEGIEIDKQITNKSKKKKKSKGKVNDKGEKLSENVSTQLEKHTEIETKTSVQKLEQPENVEIISRDFVQDQNLGQMAISVPVDELKEKTSISENLEIKPQLNKENLDVQEDIVLKTQAVCDTPMDLTKAFLLGEQINYDANTQTRQSKDTQLLESETLTDDQFTSPSNIVHSLSDLIENTFIPEDDSEKPVGQDPIQNVMPLTVLCEKVTVNLDSPNVTTDLDLEGTLSKENEIISKPEKEQLDVKETGLADNNWESNVAIIESCRKEVIQKTKHVPEMIPSLVDKLTPDEEIAINQSKQEEQNKTDQIYIEEVPCTCLVTEQPQENISQVTSPILSESIEKVPINKTKGKKRKKKGLKVDQRDEEIQPSDAKDEELETGHKNLPKPQKFDLIQQISSGDRGPEKDISDHYEEHFKEVSTRPKEKIKTSETVFDAPVDFTRAFLLGEQIYFESDQPTIIDAPAVEGQKSDFDSSAHAVELIKVRDETMTPCEKSGTYVPSVLDNVPSEEMIDQTNLRIIESLLEDDSFKETDKTEEDAHFVKVKDKQTLHDIPVTDSSEETQEYNIPCTAEKNVPNVVPGDDICASVENITELERSQNVIPEDFRASIISKETKIEASPHPWVDEMMEVTLKNLDDTTSVLTMYKKTECIERSFTTVEGETSQHLENSQFFDIQGSSSFIGGQKDPKLTQTGFTDTKYMKGDYSFPLQTDYFPNSNVTEITSITDPSPKTSGQTFISYHDTPVCSTSITTSNLSTGSEEYRKTVVKTVKRTTKKVIYGKDISEVQLSSQRFDEPDSEITITEVDNEQQPDILPEIKSPVITSEIFHHENIPEEEPADTNISMIEVATVEIPPEPQKKIEHFLTEKPVATDVRTTEVIIDIPTTEKKKKETDKAKDKSKIREKTTKTGGASSANRKGQTDIKDEVSFDTSLREVVEKPEEQLSDHSDEKEIITKSDELVHPKTPKPEASISAIGGITSIFIKEETHPTQIISTEQTILAPVKTVDSKSVFSSLCNIPYFAIPPWERHETTEFKVVTDKITAESDDHQSSSDGFTPEKSELLETGVFTTEKILNIDLTTTEQSPSEVEASIKTLSDEPKVEPIKDYVAPGNQQKKRKRKEKAKSKTKDREGVFKTYLPTESLNKESDRPSDVNVILPDSPLVDILTQEKEEVLTTTLPSMEDENLGSDKLEKCIALKDDETLKSIRTDPMRTIEDKSISLFIKEEIDASQIIGPQDQLSETLSQPAEISDASPVYLKETKYPGSNDSVIGKNKLVDVTEIKPCLSESTSFDENLPATKSPESNDSAISKDKMSNITEMKPCLSEPSSFDEKVTSTRNPEGDGSAISKDDEESLVSDTFEKIVKDVDTSKPIKTDPVRIIEDRSISLFIKKEIDTSQIIVPQDQFSETRSQPAEISDVSTIYLEETIYSERDDSAIDKDKLVDITEIKSCLNEPASFDENLPAAKIPESDDSAISKDKVIDVITEIKPCLNEAASFDENLPASKNPEIDDFAISENKISDIITEMKPCLSEPTLFDEKVTSSRNLAIGGSAVSKDDEGSLVSDTFEKRVKYGDASKTIKTDPESIIGDRSISLFIKKEIDASQKIEPQDQLSETLSQLAEISDVSPIYLEETKYSERDDSAIDKNKLVDIIEIKPCLNEPTSLDENLPAAKIPESDDSAISKDKVIDVMTEIKPCLNVPTSLNESVPSTEIPENEDSAINMAKVVDIVTAINPYLSGPSSFDEKVQEDDNNSSNNSLLDIKTKDTDAKFSQPDEISDVFDEQANTTKVSTKLPYKKKSQKGKSKGKSKIYESEPSSTTPVSSKVPLEKSEKPSNQSELEINQTFPKVTAFNEEIHEESSFDTVKLPGKEEHISDTLSTVDETIPETAFSDKISENVCSVTTTFINEEVRAIQIIPSEESASIYISKQESDLKLNVASTLAVVEEKPPQIQLEEISPEVVTDSFVDKVSAIRDKKIKKKGKGKSKPTATETESSYILVPESNKSTEENKGSPAESVVISEGSTKSANIESVLESGVKLHTPEEPESWELLIESEVKQTVHDVSEIELPPVETVDNVTSEKSYVSTSQADDIGSQQCEKRKNKKKKTKIDPSTRVPTTDTPENMPLAEYIELFPQEVSLSEQECSLPCSTNLETKSEPVKLEPIVSGVLKEVDLKFKDAESPEEKLEIIEPFDDKIIVSTAEKQKPHETFTTFKKKTKKKTFKPDNVKLVEKSEILPQLPAKTEVEELKTEFELKNIPVPDERNQSLPESSITHQFEIKETEVMPEMKPQSAITVEPQVEFIAVHTLKDEVEQERESKERSNAPIKLDKPETSGNAKKKSKKKKEKVKCVELIAAPEISSPLADKFEKVLSAPKAEEVPPSPTKPEYIKVNEESEKLLPLSAKEGSIDPLKELEPSASIEIDQSEKPLPSAEILSPISPKETTPESQNKKKTNKKKGKPEHFDIEEISSLSTIPSSTKLDATQKISESITILQVTEYEEVPTYLENAANSPTLIETAEISTFTDSVSLIPVKTEIPETLIQTGPQPPFPEKHESITDLMLNAPIADTVEASSIGQKQETERGLLAGTEVITLDSTNSFLESEKLFSSIITNPEIQQISKESDVKASISVKIESDDVSESTEIKPSNQGKSENVDKLNKGKRKSKQNDEKLKSTEELVDKISSGKVPLDSSSPLERKDGRSTQEVSLPASYFTSTGEELLPESTFIREKGTSIKRVRVETTSFLSKEKKNNTKTIPEDNLAEIDSHFLTNVPDEEPGVAESPKLLHDRECQMPVSEKTLSLKIDVSVPDKDSVASKTREEEIHPAFSHYQRAYKVTYADITRRSREPSLVREQKDQTQISLAENESTAHTSKQENVELAVEKHSNFSANVPEQALELYDRECQMPVKKKLSLFKSEEAKDPTWAIKKATDELITGAGLPESNVTQIGEKDNSSVPLHSDGVIKSDKPEKLDSTKKIQYAECEFVEDQSANILIPPLIETYAQVVRKSREPSPIAFDKNLRFDIKHSEGLNYFEKLVSDRPLSRTDIPSQTEYSSHPPSSDLFWAEQQKENTARTVLEHPPLARSAGKDIQETISKDETEISQEKDEETAEKEVVEEKPISSEIAEEEEVVKKVEVEILEEKVQLKESESPEITKTEEIMPKEDEEESIGPLRVEVRVEKEVIQSFREDDGDNTLEDLSQRSLHYESDVMSEPEEFTDSSLPKELFIESSRIDSSDKIEKDIQDIKSIELKPQFESEQREEISDFMEEISDSADETIKDSMESMLPKDDETLGNIQFEVGISELTDQTPQSADIEINAEIAFSETISNTLSKLDDNTGPSPLASPVGEKDAAKFIVQQFISEEISKSVGNEIADTKPMAPSENPNRVPSEAEVARALGEIISSASEDKQELKVEVDENIPKRGRKKLKKEPKIEVLSPKKVTEQPVAKYEDDVQHEKRISPEDELQVTVSRTTTEITSPKFEDVQFLSPKTQQSVNTVVHKTVSRHRTIKKTIKKIVYVDGKEQECTEIVEEPYTVETTEEDPSVYVSIHGNVFVDPNKQSSSITEIVEMPVTSEDAVSEECPYVTQYVVEESKEESSERDRPIIPSDKDDSVITVQEPLDQNVQITTVSERTEAPVETSVVYNVTGDQQKQVTEEAIITNSQQTVIQQRTIVKRIVRRVVIINGIEHIHEESFEEPQMLDAVTSPGISFDLPSLTCQPETPIDNNVIEISQVVETPSKILETVQFTDTVDESRKPLVTESSEISFALEPQTTVICETKSKERIDSQPETELRPKEQIVTQSFIEIETKAEPTPAVKQEITGKREKSVKQVEKISPKALPSKDQKEKKEIQKTVERTITKVIEVKEETQPAVESDVCSPTKETLVKEENVMEMQPKLEADISDIKKTEKLSTKQQPRKGKKSKTNKTPEIKVSPDIVESFIEMEKHIEPIERDTSDINISASTDVSASPTPKSKKKPKKQKQDITFSEQTKKVVPSGEAMEEDVSLLIKKTSEETQLPVEQVEETFPAVTLEKESKILETTEPQIVSDKSNVPVIANVDIEDQIDRTIYLKEVKPSEEVEIVAEEVCENLVTKPLESINEQSLDDSVRDICELKPRIRKDDKGGLEDIGKQSSTEIAGPDEETDKRERELFAPREQPTAKNLPSEEVPGSKLAMEAQDNIAPKGVTEKPRKKKGKGAKKSTKQSDEDFNVSINTKIASDKFEATSKIEVVQEYPVATNISGGLFVALDTESSNSENIPEHQIKYEVKIGEDTESIQKPTSGEETSESLSNISFETDLPSQSLESSRYVDTPSSHENNVIIYDIDTNGNQYPYDQVTVDDKIDNVAKEDIIGKESEQGIPLHEAKDELIVAIKEKLTNLNSPSYKVLLREPNNENKLKELRTNLDKLGKCKNEEKEVIIISTVTVISECLETITYIICNFKKFTSEDIPQEIKLRQLAELAQELNTYKKAISLLQAETDDCELVNAASSQIEAVETILTESKCQVETDLQKWEEFLNGINNISVLLQELAEDIENLEKEPGLTTEEKLNRLDELESTNNDYSRQMTFLITLGRSLSRPPSRVLPQDLITAAQLVSSNDESAAVLRTQLEQSRALAQEYRDTLVELQHVTKLAQAIVESRVVVNSLQHLQDEMQKDRKFFVSLSHCRSILESLEQHLDIETQQRHAELHSHLHNLASEILEKAGDRTGRLALAASRWTILEQGLAEETKWLHVALQRAPNLSGVSSTDYEQYLSLYQALSTDIDLHSGHVWKLLNTAHSLQSVICCTGLEESCDNLRYTMAQLQDKVNDDINRLLAFREVWSSFENIANKLEHWLKCVKKDKKLKKQPLDLRRFWELKAEYEVYKQIEADCGTKFEIAVATLPVSDEMAQRQLMSQLHERWSSVEDLLSEVEAAMSSSFDPPSGCTTAHRLAILEGRLAEMEAALADSQGVVKTDEQLQVYIGRLKVVQAGVTEVQEGLLKLGMVHGTSERAKVTELQGIARRLETQVSNELQGVMALSDRLARLKKGLARAARDQDRASAVLDQCSACLDMEYGDVRQALVNSKGVVKALSEHWSELMSLRQLLHSIPLGVKVSVSPIQCERDMSRLQDTHTALENRAAALVSALSARTGLWDEFHGQLDAVRHSVREADYMMEMLQVQGPLDYHRLVKATDRLKGVRETLETRETGLEELRASGRRLEEVVKEEVAIKLRAEVQAEELAFRNTQAELEQLVTKYDKAVSLWSTYNKAKEEVLPNQQLTPEEWEEKKEHLDELARLAAEISHHVGVEVLRPEVDSLSKRLKEAQEALQSIDKIQASLSTPAGQHPQIILDAIQQSLKKPEGNPTEQLVLLRDHLIALGKAEPHITSITKDGTESVTKDEDESPDLSVLQLLQLWEKIFRETFQEYHRLSSRLVHTEESNTVLKLWQDYLTHVNQFLESEPPQHYHELSEQVQLCQVHHNVLSCQKSLVPTHKGGMDDAVVQQFNLLTNVHNETLAKIMEKQAQIQDRIKIWEKYRKDQADLLNWLKDTEVDRNKLKLHYISAKSLPKTLLLIEDLLKRLNDGEEMEKALNLKLSEILKFCDDNLKNTLCVEHSSVTHRLTNLQAALLTWKDYLIRVKEGLNNYESQMNKIQSAMKDIQTSLKEESESPIILIPHSQLKERKNKLEKVSKSVEELTGEIRMLEDLRDKLKDSLSPTEVKLMSQRCWLISQQQCDLSHQLAMAILAIEDRLQLAILFDKRLERFLSWAGDVDARLERMTSQGFADAGQALRRLETEIQAETTLRKREVDWLNKTGEELLAVEERSSKRANQLESDLAKLKEIWGSVLSNTDARAAKLRAIIQGISDLNAQIEELRVWLLEIETKLSHPIVIKYANKEYIDQILKEHDDVQTEIEKQSTKIGDVLNLCELLLSDCNSCHISLDNEGINLAMTNLEKRWKMICINSAERKSAILGLWTKIQQLMKRAQEQRIWLEEISKELNEQEILLEKKCYIENVSQISQDFANLENEVKQGINDRLVPLDTMYRHMLREYTLPEEVAGLPEELCERGDFLLKRTSENARNSANKAAQLERFTRTQAKAITGLAKCDGLLTMAQLSIDGGTVPSDIDTSIKKIEYELKEEAGTLSEADSSGLEVMKWTCDKDLAQVQTMIDEYQDLWKDINGRLAILKDSIILPKQVADRGVEVNTLKFEMDRSTQVDTLGWSSPMMRKDAYISELHKTCTEFETLLIKLQKLEQLDTHQKISKCIGQCVSSFELAQHLSQSLKEQCEATDSEALVPKLKSLGEQFAKIKQQAQQKLQQLRETSAHGKLSCPLCSNKNWKQLDNDLWRLEQWLQYAEGTLASQPSTPPSSIEQLEDAIQDQRELLLDLDSHRSLVVSMNIVGTHLAEHSDSEEKAQELRTRLARDNAKWDQVCESAAAWQAKLQLALIQNEEFHETIEEMTEWVEKTEQTVRQSEPIDLNEPSHLIQAKYDKFKELRHELEKCEPRIVSLEEAARQVLSHQQEENTSANLCQQRLTRLRLRLQSLSRLTALYMSRLAGGTHASDRLPSLDTLSQQLLESTSRGFEDQYNGNEVDTSTLVRCHRFFGRVMRASVPISAFLLLLLGAASLLPTTQHDFSCSNNLFYNLVPILRYPNGHPPI